MKNNRLKLDKIYGPVKLKNKQSEKNWKPINFLHHFAQLRLKINYKVKKANLNIEKIVIAIEKLKSEKANRFSVY